VRIIQCLKFYLIIFAARRTNDKRSPEEKRGAHLEA